MYPGHLPIREGLMHHVISCLMGILGSSIFLAVPNFMDLEIEFVHILFNTSDEELGNVIAAWIMFTGNVLSRKCNIFVQFLCPLFRFRQQKVKDKS